MSTGCATHTIKSVMVHVAVHSQSLCRHWNIYTWNIMDLILTIESSIFLQDNACTPQILHEDAYNYISLGVHIYLRQV